MLIDWLEINQLDVFGGFVGSRSFIATAIKTDTLKYIKTGVDE